MSSAAIVESGAPALTESAERYRRDGALVLRGFLDPDRHIRPLQEQIGAVIEMARAEAGLPRIERGPDADAFDAGLPELLSVDRDAVARVYDAVRKLPAFFEIAGAPRMWELVRALTGTDLPGWYAQGSGIRMDHPGEGGTCRRGTRSIRFGGGFMIRCSFLRLLDLEHDVAFDRRHDLGLQIHDRQL